MIKLFKSSSSRKRHVFYFKQRKPKDPMNLNFLTCEITRDCTNNIDKIEIKC